MAVDTDVDLQHQVIYEVFVRDHTDEGTFEALEADLPRIRELGVDVVWLMPIHPIGELERKGTLGSPYANRDYRAVNPDYGTREDLAHLVDAIHDQGMRCLIDVVYNHTSPDSVLFEEHPEFFYHDKDGQPGNKIGDWADVIDLDYSVPELWDYQIETLVDWARIVDGFRCDVASFVPVEFWERARAAVAEVRPDAIWLAETVHRGFGAMARRLGFYAARDPEVYRAFDIEYAYDIQDCWDAYLQGIVPLSHYLDLLDFEENTYPANYNKLRYLENHDMPRIASRLDLRALGAPFSVGALTAFFYFLKGTTLIYAGEELCAGHLPSLFEREPIDWSGLGTDRDISPLLARLSRIKHEVLGAEDHIRGWSDDAHDVAVLVRDGERGRSVGVFPLAGADVPVNLTQPISIGVGETVLTDGTYENLIDGSRVEVLDGFAKTNGMPVIVHGD